MINLVDKKIEFFKDFIQKTIIHVQKNKFFEIKKFFGRKRYARFPARLFFLKHLKNNERKL